MSNSSPSRVSASCKHHLSAQRTAQRPADDHTGKQIDKDRQVKPATRGGFAGLGMPLVVRQLVVFNRGAVIVLTFGGSQIHVYASSVYALLMQVKTAKPCAYKFDGRSRLLRSLPTVFIRYDIGGRVVLKPFSAYRPQTIGVRQR